MASKAALLRAELAVAEAEEKFEGLKQGRLAGLDVYAKSEGGPWEFPDGTVLVNRRLAVAYFLSLESPRERAKFEKAKRELRDLRRSHRDLKFGTKTDVRGREQPA